MYSLELKNIIKNNARIQRETNRLEREYYSARKKLDPKYNSREEYQELWKNYKEEWNEVYKDWQEGDMRLLHIAHSLMKGRSYEEIERPKKENELTDYSWRQIYAIMGEYYVKEMERRR